MVVLLVVAFVAQVVAASAVAVLSATGGLSCTINRASTKRALPSSRMYSRPVRSKHRRFK
ncbi:hypothetical protein ACQEV9_16665 [Streptomyces chartreusis]|uniref:hypothetical protein n=1 Tax=Streptomyces chartreusis TaxID=1969 RepID=UPI003D89CF88